MRIANPYSFGSQASREARPVLRLLVVAGFFLSFGFNTWNAMFNNFAADVLRLDAGQVGWIQSLREIPGLMGFVLGFIVLFVPEMRLVGFCVTLLGGGLLLMSGAKDYASLLVATMIMSIGFHFFDSSNASLVLTYTSKDDAPKTMGILASIGAAAAVAGTLVILTLAKPLGYRQLLYLIGALTLAGGLIVTVLGRQGATEKVERKVVFRRRYWLYYLLTFLMGSRRHIFSTFAIFLLVTEHGVTVEQSAALFLVNSVITTLTYPQIGRLVARYGERLILAVNFALLALIFIGYAYIAWLPALVLFFVADNILFGFSLALNTYFQKIAATPEEITSNVSMGQTINHLSAVFVPALGGLLWKLYGYQVTFLAGTAIVLVGLVFTRWVRVK